MSQNNLKYLLKILSGIFFKKNANNFLLIHFYIQQKKTLTGNVSGFLFILVIKCHIIQYMNVFDDYIAKKRIFEFGYNCN